MTVRLSIESDTSWWHKWAAEYIDMVGRRCQLWSLRQSESERDPLYDEPLNSYFEGPFELLCIMRSSEKSVEAHDEGKMTTVEVELVFAAEHFKALGLKVAVGDVVEMLDEPGGFYDVVHVSHEGLAKGVGNVVVCRGQFRSKFSPARKIAES